MAHHIGGWHHGALDQVVCDIEQAREEGLVASHTFGKVGFAVGRRWRVLQDETTFGAHRHDHGVLHHLRLHQTQNLGTEILTPVGPAQASARHLATAQMHPFHPGRIHPDLEQRLGLGHAGNAARAELEAHVVAPLLVHVRSQRGIDRAQELAQHTVFFQAGHIGEQGFNDLYFGVCPLLAALGFSRVEAQRKQLEQVLRNQRALVQRVFDVALAESKTQLLEVAHIGPQDSNRTRMEIGGQHQPVERVAFHLVAPHRMKQLFKARLEIGHIQRLGKGHAPVVDPVPLRREMVGVFVQHAGTHGLHHRHGIGKGDLLCGIGLQADLALAVVQVQGQRLQLAQVAQDHRVLGRGFGVKIFTVGGGEGVQQVAQPGRPLATACQQHGVHTVDPALAGLCHLRFQLGQVHVQGQLASGTHDVVNARQGAVGEHGCELDRFGIKRLCQQGADLDPQLGGVDIAWHINQHRRELAKRAATHEQANPLALLQPQDTDRVLRQRVRVDLQDFVTRIGFKNGLHGLVRVAAFHHARRLQQCRDQKTGFPPPAGQRHPCA